MPTTSQRRLSRVKLPTQPAKRSLTPPMKQICQAETSKPPASFLQMDRPELHAECGPGEVILPALILQLIQLLVIRTALQKGLMRSYVNDTAFVHYDDLVGIENG